VLIGVLHFLPWHTRFTQFEVALQNEEPSVSLPYWDSTLDQGLPEPSDSVMYALLVEEPVPYLSANWSSYLDLSTGGARADDRPEAQPRTLNGLSPG
ncbi:hypothetical protein OSTOST_21854, partial [Ostertagia ostertagi]